jgi:mono/diheme cytochrome c family protein
MVKCQDYVAGFYGMFAIAFLLGGSLQAQVPESPTVNLSASALRGKELFQDYCFLCHDRPSERVKPLGPSLNGLFKRQTLLVGKPVNEANVTEVIRTGPTPGMPSFRYALTEQQIGDIVEFLKTK